MINPERSRAVVLVADDDDLVRLVLRRTLERDGMTVVEADNGAAIGAAIDGVTLDLAIVDAHMPGTDLSEVLTGLRHVQSELPLLVISGDASAPVDPRLPPFSYLAKPVTIDLFTATVASLIGHRDA